MIIAFHPDKYQGDKKFAYKKTHEIIEAYKVLCNPITRKTYDESIYPKAVPASDQPNMKASASAAQRQRNYKETDTGAAAIIRIFKSRKAYLILGIIGVLSIVFVVVFFVLVLMYAAR